MWSVPLPGAAEIGLRSEYEDGVEGFTGRVVATEEVASCCGEFGNDERQYQALLCAVGVVDLELGERDSLGTLRRIDAVRDREEGSGITQDQMWVGNENLQ